MLESSSQSTTQPTLDIGGETNCKHRFSVDSLWRGVGHWFARNMYKLKQVPVALHDMSIGEFGPVANIVDISPGIVVIGGIGCFVCLFSWEARRCHRQIVQKCLSIGHGVSQG